MKRHSRGFGLIELMIALTLGLVVIAGITQIFVAAKSTYTSQTASAGMQEDARFVLSKMLQEIRMVGMIGCVGTVADSSASKTYTTAMANPITWDSTNNILTLVTADVGANGIGQNWTVLSDCLVLSTANDGVVAPAAGQIAIPLRQVAYTFKTNQIYLGAQALINNVNAFSVLFGMAKTPLDTVASSYSATPSNPALIRSVRLTLTLQDPTSKVRNQTFSVEAAVRNRLR